MPDIFLFRRRDRDPYGVCNRWKSDQHFLEREIDRLFALGCASPEGLLDVDSFRVVVHALDPFELESNIAAMHREADILGTYVKHSLNAPRV